MLGVWTALKINYAGCLDLSCSTVSTLQLDFAAPPASPAPYLRSGWKVSLGTLLGSLAQSLAGKSRWEVSLGSLAGKSRWEVSLLGVRGALSGVGWRGKLEARGRTFLWVAWQGRVRNPTRNHQEASTCPRTRLQIQFGRQGITCSREHTLEDKLVHRGLAQLVKG